ncbi:hypothetical protein [Jeotgalibaca porci]|uniref:hypothetical protein n=1 Tax=Jeotgalibaca porci TaxID=1868793 RepID=UPI0035A196BC
MMKIDKDALEMAYFGLEEAKQTLVGDQSEAYYQIDIVKDGNLYFFYLGIYSEGNQYGKKEFQVARNFIEFDSIVNDIPHGMKTTYVEAQDDSLEVTEDNYLDELVSKGTATITLTETRKAKSLKAMIKKELEYAEIEAVIGKVVKKGYVRTITVEMKK